MSEVTGSCEDNDGYQAVDKYREHGIECITYEKHSDFFFFDIQEQQMKITIIKDWE